MFKSTQGASPNSRRFFYPASRAHHAKCMAIDFGMLFFTPEDDEYQEEIYGADTIDQAFESHGAERLYVHPDSLYLLEPKDGDAVEFDRWHWERQRHEDMRDAPYQSHFGRVHLFKNTRPDGGDWLQISSAGVGWDDNYHGQFALPFKIIQRNGIAFMWPESEAA